MRGGGGGGDGSTGELDPKDEKNMELRDGCGAGVWVSADVTGTGRDGGVSHVMGALKISFLLGPLGDDLTRSSCRSAVGESAVETTMGLSGSRVDFGARLGA